MGPDTIGELLKMAIMEAAIVILPIAGGALLVGITVGLLQTVTSIQEQTLTFVPKLVAAAMMIYFLGPWMLQRLGGMATLFIQRAGDVLR